MKKLVIAVMANLIVAPTAALADVGCQGTVTKVLLKPEGAAYAEFGFGRIRLCDIDGTLTVDRGPSHGGTAGVTPTMCQALYSSFLTAKASSRQVIAYIERSDCNLVDGAIPNPYPWFFYFL